MYFSWTSSQKSLYDVLRRGTNASEWVNVMSKRQDTKTRKIEYDLEIGMLLDDPVIYEILTNRRPR